MAYKLTISDKNHKKGSDKNAIQGTFIAKYSIITAVVTLVVAQMYNTHIDRFVSYIVAPLFSVDLNMNGHPDLMQMRNYQFSVFNAKFKFPIGMIFYNFIELCVKLLILLIIIKLMLKFVLPYF